MFLKVNSPKIMGELTPKVNSRSEYATQMLLVVWCKIIEGRIWALVYCRVDSGVVAGVVKFPNS